jgi:hypothetical protein
VKFDTNPVKRSCYAAYFSIFKHASSINELDLLNVHDSFSLLLLVYAVPALTHYNTQIDELLEFFQYFTIGYNK